MPSISISTLRQFTLEAKASRAVYLSWPMGHALGEPNFRKQQMTVLKKTLEALVKIKKPGTIINLPYRWGRREDLDKEFEIPVE